MELGDRKLKVLQAIIKDFINTAEPVGSRTIAKKYELGISSATIRNEMADLEEMGYLEQPHTSAGRIPSDKGYRLYVDNLMILNQLAQAQREAIKYALLDRIGEVEHIISHTAKILSQMTKLTSMVLSPQFKQSRLKHVQLVPIDEKSILLVMVSESGVVKNATLRITENYNDSQLMQISKLLNTTLKGLTIGEINTTIVAAIQKELYELYNLINHVIAVIIETLEEMEDVHLYLDGHMNIFQLPEYNNISKAREFMSMLEQKEFLKDLLIKNQEPDKIGIRIGKENIYKEMKDCSLVTATYHLNGKMIGKIGVIGPTRMDYDHIISVVDYMTKYLSKMLGAPEE